MKKIAIILAAVMLLSLVGCGAKVDGEASVQSVAMICGIGSTGLVNRFSGVVSARSEQNITRDDNKTISEMDVAEGDLVSAGQVLFTYDMEEAQLNLEKAQLELEQLQASVTSKSQEKEKLEAEAAKAKESEQLDYTLAIQECDTSIRETNYNITLKEKEVQRISDSLTNLDVVSPVDGKILQINEDGGYDNSGNALPFMKIIETGTYRVKGYVNENNVASLSEGTPVIIRSRVDENVSWTGYVSTIDWENPASNSSSYYYGYSDDTSNSSKYPFYVELDSADGLLLGQHVYIEPDYGQDAEEDGSEIRLPEYYINDADSDPWVWAENSKGLLEKRSISLGEYDEMNCTWTVEDGLTAEDYIEYPDDTLQAGMSCTEFDESAFNNGGIDAGSESYYEDGAYDAYADYEDYEDSAYEDYENSDYSESGIETDTFAAEG